MRPASIGRWRCWWNVIADMLYPPLCLTCRSGGPDTWPLCRACRNRARRLMAARCEICGREYPTPCTGPMRCANCAGRTFAFDRFGTAYAAEGVVRECVHLLKYRRNRAVVPTLADWAMEGLQTGALAGWQPDCLVPVPLHPKRERRRGFNQSKLIACALGERTGWEVADLLARRVNTATQTRFDRRQRMKNLRGAFVAGPDAAVVCHRPLLVDDILTTGSTLHECAVALRQLGAVEVGALTVARG